MNESSMQRPSGIHSGCGARSFHEESLPEHLVVLHLWGVLPSELLEQFWRSANERVRQHAMWFLGQQFQDIQLPDEIRTRGLSYWEGRLAIAKDSANLDTCREELGVMGNWCAQCQVDELWLCDQLMAVFNAGFVPTDAFSVIDWLQKISAQHADRAVEVLARLLMDPRVH